MSEHIETVVIGGGQAGLAVGYHLHRNDLPFLILDENARIGDVWRNRWDSLRLFTPACLQRAAGHALSRPRSAYPTKDETADYFEAYAERFGLPVRTGVKVDRLSDSRGWFRGDLRAMTTLLPTTSWWRPVPISTRASRPSRPSSTTPSSSSIRPSTAIPTSCVRGSPRRRRRQLGCRDRPRYRRSPPGLALRPGHRTGAHPGREHPRPAVDTDPVVGGDPADGENRTRTKAP